MKASEIQPGFAGRKTITDNKNWCTPRKLVDAVKAVLGGGIDLDPCSNPDSIVDAKREVVLPEDGLFIEWADYRRIFVNPPYGRDPERGTTIADWIRKCRDAWLGGSEVIALIPVATNTAHWKTHIFGNASAVCFLADTRLKFRIDGSEDNKGSPQACALVLWGSPETTERFVLETEGRGLGFCVRTSRN